MATQIGPKIGIEGEKEYRAQIQEIINQTKNLDAAMNKTASSWDQNTSEMTKNKATAQKLVQQIDLYEQKLKLMNDMLEKSSEKYGENDRKTQSWQRSIDHTTASLNNMKQQLASLGNAENFSDFATQMADLGTQIENVGAKLAVAGGVMTASITTPLVAAGSAAVKLASDLEESSSKVDVIFGNMSESVKSFTDTSLESYGLSNVKAMEMLGSFGALATQLGISDSAAAEMAETLTGLSGDLASFHNAEADVAASALEGIFTGQTKALTRFAGAIREVDLEEFAQKMGKTYSSMSEAEKVMTRYELVLQRTSDAQGDYMRTSDGTANSIHTFQGAVQQLGAAFGEVLLPIITPVIQALTKVIRWVEQLPGPVKSVIVVIALVVAAVGPLLATIGLLMMSLGNIITYAPVVAGAFSTMGAAVSGLIVKFAALIAAAAPWLVLVAAIAAAAYLVYANWDKISEVLSEVGTSIANASDEMLEGERKMIAAARNGVDVVVEYFAELPEKISKALREAVNSIKDEFNNMIARAKQSGKDFIDGFVNGIKERVSKIVDAVKDIAKTIEEFLGFSCPDKGPLSKYESWMPDFMNGLAKGIEQNKSVVTRAINDLSKEMVLPLDASASMNMALAGTNDTYSAGMLGGFTMNVSVDHINDLNDLLRIQQQAQQRLRMGAR